MNTMPDAIKRWKPPRPQLKRQREQVHYTTDEWASKRTRILIRDSNTCRACSLVVCGKSAHVDHITPLEDGGTDADANLQTLCISCHSKKTRQEQLRKGLA